MWAAWKIQPPMNAPITPTTISPMRPKPAPLMIWPASQPAMRPTTRATIKVCCSMTAIPSVRSSNPASIAVWRLVALQRSIIAGRAAAVAREAKYPRAGDFHETGSPPPALVLHRSMVCARLPGITFTARPTLFRRTGMTAVAKLKTPQAAARSLYEIGEIPPLGQDEVLLFVMAGGVNYNGVWAGLGQPISPLDVHKNPFHVAGSDASGVVWAIGDKVRRWKVGDEGIVHCNQDDGDDEECNGGDPLLSPSQRIWGYETPDGSFAQFCRVQSRQLMPKPAHLSWEEAACYTLTLATAYRMLYGHPPHTLKPGDYVLVWGASGGLGVFGVQLVAASGANAIGVVSDESKRDYVMQLGAKGVINRKDFACWGAMPKVGTPEYDTWVKEARKFGKAIWEITGKRDVDIVFEHPGEATFPVSCLVVKRGGMVVFCAGTSGYNITFDARYVWMRQERIQGSHFAHLK